MFFSCIQPNVLPATSSEHKVSSLLKTEKSYPGDIHTLDIFVFDPDGKLDCYQRMKEPDYPWLIASGSGAKQFLLIANSCWDTYEWPEIKSLNSIARINADLEKERRNSPLMSRLFEINAGEDGYQDMHPVRCEVVLKTLRCDFSNESYAKEQLTDVKAYLTYANASCSIIPQSPVQPSRLINPGMLDEHNLEYFLEKDIIVQDIAEHVGKQSIRADCTLFCYANEPGNESIGSPFTKLVIEGKIAGDTYYYPIRINPEGRGLAPGGRYTFDIVITRAGATHPDGNLEEEDIVVKMEVEEWTEKEWYEVEF